MLDGCTPWPAEFAVRYREAGYWTGETFSDFVTDRTRRFADRLAVVGAGQRWTYAELGERSAVLATGLARLALPGRPRRRPTPQHPRTAEVVFALFRSARCRCTRPAHRAHEITHLCTTAQAKALSSLTGTPVSTTDHGRSCATPALPPNTVVVGEPGGSPLAEPVPTGLTPASSLGPRR